MLEDKLEINILGDQYAQDLMLSNEDVLSHSFTSELSLKQKIAKSIFPLPTYLVSLFKEIKSKKRLNEKARSLASRINSLRTYLNETKNMFDGKDTSRIDYLKTLSSLAELKNMAHTNNPINEPTIHQLFDWISPAIDSYQSEFETYSRLNQLRKKSIFSFKIDFILFGFALSIAGYQTNLDKIPFEVKSKPNYSCSYTPITNSFSKKTKNDLLEAAQLSLISPVGAFTNYFIQDDSIEVSGYEVLCDNTQNKKDYFFNSNLSFSQDFKTAFIPKTQNSDKDFKTAYQKAIIDATKIRFDKIQTQLKQK